MIFSNGSSGLGSDKSDTMERRIVDIFSAGDHLFFKISKHILPPLEIFTCINLSFK